MPKEIAAVDATPIRPAKPPERRSFSTPATPYSAKGLPARGPVMASRPDLVYGYRGTKAQLEIRKA